VGFLVGFDSPNQCGVEGTNWEEVWIISESSAILFMLISLIRMGFYFLIKETYF